MPASKGTIALSRLAALKRQADKKLLQERHGARALEQLQLAQGCLRELKRERAWIEETLAQKHVMVASQMTAVANLQKIANEANPKPLTSGTTAQTKDCSIRY